MVGAAVVARLHTDATFMADVAAAKVEVAAARAKGPKPRSDECAAEAKAYWLNGTDDDITSLKGGAAKTIP
jgi:acid phosphatase (class A)